MNGNNDSLSIRREFVEGFFDTMLTMWQEHIAKLDVIDTGRLLGSVTKTALNPDAQFLSMNMSWDFLEYGLWQEYGTGREVARGNSGDMGRYKVRERKKWLLPPYFRSTRKMARFLSENVGEQLSALYSDAFGDSTLKASTDYYKRNKSSV